MFIKNGNKRKNFVLGQVLILLLSSVVQAEINKNQFTTRSVIIHEPNKNYLFLGYNYDESTKKRYQFACVMGKKINAGNVKSSVYITNNLDYDTAIKINSGDLNAEVESMQFSAGVGSSWAKDVASNSLTNSINITFFYTPKKEVLIPENSNYGALKINDFCQRFYHSDNKSYQKNFGDSFITSINRVASLSISLVMSSSSKSDRDFLSGNIRVSAMKIANIKGELIKEFKKLKNSTKITLIINQKGGDSSKLLSFGGTNGKAISDCSLSKANDFEALNRCMKIFNLLIDYAKKDFKSQLKTISDYAIVGYNTSKFKHSGLSSLSHKKPHVFIDIYQKSLVSELKNRYKNYISDNKISNYKLENTEYLSDHARKSLQSISNISLQNSEIVKESIIYCEKNPYGKKCIDNYEIKKNEIIKYSFNYN